MPSWTWIEDGIDRSEESIDDITPTLNALAREWSEMHSSLERRQWARESDIESGYDAPEDPECPHCIGGYLEDYRNPVQVRCSRCHEFNPSVVYVRITCGHCNGDGVDRKAMAEEAKRERQVEADREVRVDIIEAMLEKYGARMMRPYEHWNEDERLMEYMERDRD